MKVEIKIKQIENGFILHLYDEDGSSEHDQDLFFQSLDQVLQKITQWTDEAAESETQEED